MEEETRVATVNAKVREIVDGFMRSYSALKGKSLWAEKTPANVEHADRLYKTFPDGAYLCLHRNPFDMIRSGWESTRYGKLKYDLWDYRGSLEFYIQQTRMLLDFERKHRDQTFRVQYEPLVLNPVETLDRLFAFLGLDWDPALVEAVFATEHDWGPGDPKAGFATKLYTTSIGRGATAEVLSELEKAPKHLLKELNELLRELNYPDLDATLNAAAHTSNPVDAETITASTDSHDISNLFTRHFPTKLERPHRRTADLKGVAKFIVRGAGGGTWTIDLDVDPPAIQPVNRDADCTITIKSDDLVKLASGDLNVGECYLQARIRVAGNDALAVTLGRALFS